MSKFGVSGIFLWVALLSGVFQANSWGSSTNAGSKTLCELQLSRVNSPYALDYPASIKPEKLPDGYYMYGVEAEYSLDRMSERLLNHYAPTENLISRDEWIHRLSASERVAWVKGHQEVLFPEGPKHKSNLVRISSDPRLPEWLIFDETGNVELVSKPFDTHGEFEDFLNFVEREIGSGYYQSSISAPGEIAYRSESAADGFIGYRLFLGTFDEIAKLDEAYDKHLSSPGYIPAKAFTHPFLSPMNSNRANFLRRMVHQNRVGDFNDDMLERVSSRNASYKYTSQVAYRPDILKTNERFINEVRDCVKDADCLKRRINRERYFLGADLKKFVRFESARPMDLIADFDLLPESVQLMLKRTFPRTSRLHLIEVNGEMVESPDWTVINDDASEHLVDERFRTFSYPLQDWSSWLEPMSISTRSPEYQRIKMAQHEYIVALSAIARRLEASEVSVQAAGNEIRVALAKFIRESGLKEIFWNWLTGQFPDWNS